MNRGTFMDIVGLRYDDIKRTYSLRDKNNNRKFDEDSFNDAFIKCAKHFGNELIQYEDVIKYFWIAYVNTRKGNDYKYKSNIELYEEYPDNIIDDDSDSLAERFYKITMDAITEAFGEEDMIVYSLYKYHGWKEKDLIEAGYNCNNLQLRIKNIHRFVKEYTKKHNNILQEPL